MSDIMMPLLILGIGVGGIYLLIHKDELLGTTSAAPPPVVDVVKDSSQSQTPSSSSSVTLGPTDTASAGKDVPASDQNKGPFNYGPASEGPDKGYGFSKDGGPVESDGYTADDHEPRVGDNRGNKSMTIAMLPGPCETALYKGLVQYRHNNLSASADSCTHAKQYFLYKYGVGANTNPPSGGGSSTKTTSKTKAPVYKKPTTTKKKKAHFVMVQSPYTRVSL